MGKSKFTRAKGKLQQDILSKKSFEKFHTLNQYIQSKQKLIIISTVTGFVIICSSYGVYFYNSDTIYHVIVDGQEIGIVSDKKIVEDWENEYYIKLQEEYTNINLDLNNDIAFVSERKLKVDYNNDKTLDALENIVEYEATGISIVIDGKLIGVVNNEETANSLLNNIKEEYMPKKNSSVLAASFGESGNEEVLLNSIEIKEEVMLEETKILPEGIISEDNMFTLLKKGTLEEKIYIVQEGDTISEIAVKFGLTTEQVYKMNPWLNSELIHIGDEVVVTAMTPPVTVLTSENTKQIERIPYSVEYRADDSMYVNESKILVKGIEGEKLVEYAVVKENGNVIEKTILSEEIKEEPTSKIILKGTKIVPSKGSGAISWPTVGGIITSDYGPRWGSFHYGIDISGVNNRTIKAADSGKVSFAGYKGGYGYCVIIDHGNGIQTLYGHLNTISVSVGSSIAKGQKIGIMGNTGNSYGVHLHFEVIVNGEKRNPINYIGN